MCDDDKRTEVYNHEVHANHRRYLEVLKQEFLAIYANPRQYDKQPDDFDKIKVIGAGAFGTVFLARDKLSFDYHAMKAIDKVKVVEKDCVKQLLSEKRILECINFPFLMNLDYCCKDYDYIYLLSKYESGGELFGLMRRAGCLSETVGRFYIAQLVLALEYLHFCGAIHRDVKPENVYITEAGYIKLGDMGFSKLLKKRTWTLCGTPEYLAPEIIMSKGYTYSVDWWSLGILIFEMVAGSPPFFHSNPMVLYERILDGHFKSPAGLTPECKLLLKGLLQVDSSKRLGALRDGVYDIKSHAWFKDIHWSNLLEQHYEPPQVNVIKGARKEWDDIKLRRSSECLYPDEFEEF